MDKDISKWVMGPFLVGPTRAAHYMFTHGPCQLVVMYIFFLNWAHEPIRHESSPDAFYVWIQHACVHPIIEVEPFQQWIDVLPPVFVFPKISDHFIWSESEVCISGINVSTRTYNCCFPFWQFLFRFPYLCRTECSLSLICSDRLFDFRRLSVWFVLLA